MHLRLEYTHIGVCNFFLNSFSGIISICFCIPLVRILLIGLHYEFMIIHTILGHNINSLHNLVKTRAILEQFCQTWLFILSLLEEFRSDSTLFFFFTRLREQSKSCQLDVDNNGKISPQEIKVEMLITP